ncbi:hypothetical protein Hlac_1171 [Halorubrum lacusprofundi ATCC 49239]|jgi:hypothetical protein|uniref:Uncharacterized protein n=1 Tax=Halorubrum lacusprofundi (strain ATCC 49239 / DSM 5036 / JCM 8891 / ACAM 34) TaxID=416348 RepID=B9LN27_HALLT|nr:hypothetical protein [Halorubrum lacusprofundi]ACM56765.1 hypothetical protein Hlac_1171 [Halorubrum lacusprofundi ATCC 49239]MCG1007754.1 hypothetical protein [Halorubrum lacusprofundi]
MPQIHLDEEPIGRLDALRIDDEEYDEIVSGLINVSEAEELTLFRGSDLEYTVLEYLAPRTPPSRAQLTSIASIQPRTRPYS